MVLILAVYRAPPPGRSARRCSAGRAGSARSSLMRRDRRGVTLRHRARSSGCSAYVFDLALRRLRAVRRRWRCTVRRPHPAAVSRAPVPTDGWAIGGLTYASYNVVGAVAILPFLRHLTQPPRRRRSPGLLAARWRCCRRCCSSSRMIAFYPAIRRRGAAVRLPAAADRPAAGSTCCSS